MKPVPSNGGDQAFGTSGRTFVNDTDPFGALNDNKMHGSGGTPNSASWSGTSIVYQDQGRPVAPKPREADMSDMNRDHVTPREPASEVNTARPENSAGGRKSLVTTIRDWCVALVMIIVLPMLAWSLNNIYNRIGEDIKAAQETANKSVDASNSIGRELLQTRGELAKELETLRGDFREGLSDFKGEVRLINERLENIKQNTQQSVEELRRRPVVQPRQE